RDTVARRLDAASRTTSELRASLRALSPAATLARGYAIAHLENGTILRDAADAPAGTALTITVDRGSVAAHSDGEIPEGAPGRPAS
ncbi:MAG: exodeoxyribonuclease VII large subunit, partial [Microbacterium sp.]|nr:exodeoxyribonuclease VII large subunit [Microbacterium sp.]